jgi:hypothetical protein
MGNGTISDPARCGDGDVYLASATIAGHIRRPTGGAQMMAFRKPPKVVIMTLQDFVAITLFWATVVVVMSVAFWSWPMPLH